LGRAAVDLGRVVQGLAVVGDQVQVDGQRLAAAAQGVGEVALQGGVYAGRELRWGGAVRPRGGAGGGCGGGGGEGAGAGGREGASRRERQAAAREQMRAAA